MTFQFANLADFLAMSGHGGYVWSCYIITILSLVYLVVSPMRRKQNLIDQLRRQARIEEAENRDSNRPPQ